jgi:hypothetical protein
VAAGAGARGADPACMVAPRDLELPARDSPPVNTVERDGDGGGPTRADADRAGTSARVLAGAAFAAADGVLAAAAGTESLAAGTLETFAEELAGVLLFTKRCSLES